jgi:broad specificity phosphatase PhoE
MQTKIYFLRHGMSEAKVKGLVQGIGLHYKLVKDGQQQAKTAAKHLKDYHFDAIFTSTAARTVATAEFVHEYHQATPLIKIPELNERSKGKTEGMLRTEFNKKYPDILAQWQREEDARVPGGENYEDVEKRVMPVIDKHLKDYQGKTLLYVMHGNVTRVILGAMLKIPYGLRPRIEQHYCAFNLVSFDHDRQRWQIKFINQVFN